VINEQLTTVPYRAPAKEISERGLCVFAQPHDEAVQ
jgi:hypothetical protein